MTDHRPPACHYDRALGYRTTPEHRDDCPGGTDCPAAGHGCAPCTAHHCIVCNRTHATNEHPQTCPTCIDTIRTDFADLLTAHDQLPAQATDAANDGRLAAAAPIPGDTAQVLTGPTVPWAAIRTGRGLTPTELAEDHHPADPTPPLAVLWVWEDRYRHWLDHTTTHHRATLTATVHYLDQQLPYIAQAADGPDFLAFATDVRTIRSQLEHALHDEKQPERGVECFECGQRLVRRFRPHQACQHRTAARDELAFWLRLGYPEAITRAHLRAARRPCGNCDQGGIVDPRAGMSWECEGCRREYGPGEYATAVRRDLLDSAGAGDGWTHITMAAEAASTLTGGLVLASTVRKWMDRGRVPSCCLWTPGRRWGVRLVYWPDVADAAVAAGDARARRALRPTLETGTARSA